MSTPISVLHVLNSYADLSISRILERIIGLADPSQFQWHVASVKEYGDYSQVFEKQGAKVLHFASTHEDPRPPWKKLKEYIHLNQIPIVHSHTPRTISVVWRSLLQQNRNAANSCKHVATKHLMTKPYDRQLGLFYTLFDLLSLYPPDYLIPVSRSMAEEIIRLPGIPSSKVRPIPNGIPCNEYFRPDLREGSRSELFLSPSTVLIGFTGRLMKVKNLDLLLRAFRNIHLNWPETKLVIAGEGDLLDDLQTLTTDLGLIDSVIWMGFYRDIPRLLSAIDIYVQPSSNEGLSLSILEAMAAEKPVISTRVASASEVITDSETGMLIPSGSAEFIERAIRSLIENPDRRKRMAIEGRKQVILAHDVQLMVDGYCQFYQEINSSIRIL